MNIKKKITFSNGSEYVCLLDERGVPKYYENLYILQRFHYESKSIHASIAALTAIQLLNAWEKANKVNVIQRFTSKKHLSSNEIRSIASYARKNLKVSADTTIQFPSPSEVRKRVKENKQSFLWNSKVSTQKQRVHAIQFYIDWLHSNLDFEGIERRSEMSRNFEKFAPSNSGGVDELPSGLSEETIQLILKQLVPNHSSNIFGDHFSQKKQFEKEAVQLRNYLQLLILYSTGMRVGELMALRIEDINSHLNTISVIRRQDDGVDQRKNKPHAKTRGRDLELDSEIINILEYYISSYRDLTASSNLHPFIFISHQGSTKGQAMSIDALASVFKKIRKHIKAKDISFFTPHSLRHAWNCRFSKHCDLNRETISFTEETEMRCYLMGWSPRSKMAEIYNKRHIKEKAKEVSMGLQNDLVFNNGNEDK